MKSLQRFFLIPSHDYRNDSWSMTLQWCRFLNSFHSRLVVINHSLAGNVCILLLYFCLVLELSKCSQTLLRLQKTEKLRSRQNKKKIVHCIVECDPLAIKQSVTGFKELKARAICHFCSSETLF